MIRLKKHYTALLILLCWFPLLSGRQDQCLASDPSKSAGLPVQQTEDFWRSLDMDSKIFDAKRRARRLKEAAEEEKEKEAKRAVQDKQRRRANQAGLKSDDSDGDGNSMDDDDDGDMDAGSSKVKQIRPGTYAARAVKTKPMPLEDRDKDKSSPVSLSPPPDRADEKVDERHTVHMQYDQSAVEADARENAAVREVHDELQDWVPAKANPLHNGGFTKAADNGSPVPYKLNGHIPFDRKLPWKTGN